MKQITCTTVLAYTVKLNSFHTQIYYNNISVSVLQVLYLAMSHPFLPEKHFTRHRNSRITNGFNYNPKGVSSKKDK